MHWESVNSRAESGRFGSVEPKTGNRAAMRHENAVFGSRACLNIKIFVTGSVGIANGCSVEGFSPSFGDEGSFLAL